MLKELEVLLKTLLIQIKVARIVEGDLPKEE